MANMAWLINCRAIAKKVKNAVFDSNYQPRDLGAEASRECPNCQHTVDNSDVSLELPGLPAGVKFDPTDTELLEHLAGKAGVGIAKAHIFIDEFIPTLDGEEGICYTHPENLPGVKKDGSSVHFFHRSLNAYSTGNRKRRKIQSGFSETEERVRWHKTGKTKPVLDNGVLKGWKKIMVLYRSSGKGSKPDKANWVLHQYHLGMEEEEKDGDMVVSKIFYQRTKQMDCNETETVREKSNFLTIRYSPRTPTTMNPQPPRSKMNPSYEADEHAPLYLEVQEEKAPEVELPPSTFPIVNPKNEKLESTLWADESQAIEESNPQLINESLLCSKVLKNFPPLEKSSLQLEKILHPSPGRAEDGLDSIMSCVQQRGAIHAVDHSSNLSDVIFSQLNYSNTIPGFIDQFEIDADSAHGFPSLEDIEVDTPPDFQLSDLQFGSQDSITSWLDQCDKDLGFS